MQVSHSEEGIGAAAALLMADERGRRETQMAEDLELEPSAAMLLPLVLSLARLAAQRSARDSSASKLDEAPG